MGFAMDRFACVISWLVAVFLCGCPAIESPSLTTSTAESAADASDALFSRPQLMTLKLELTESAVQALRDQPRAYARAKLIENGKTEYAEVAIKLKGAAGSFQDFDGKPGFTLHMSKFQKGQRFHALEKFHLNNSVQDETFLAESLAGALCREAGLPAPRVSHARVIVNDRDLGLYVVKEGFDAGFLKRHFGDATGNLYDGGFCTDIDAELEKDSGKGPGDFSDLKALRAACELEDADARRNRIAELLDVESFINFMALELMMCHWDGYTANRNNYRVYFDPTRQRACFLPHGMDQMFQDPGFEAMQFPGTIVGAAVMGNPDWRAKYRARVKELLPLFSAESLTAKVDAIDGPLVAFFKAEGEEAARDHAEMVTGFNARLAARAAVLREQLAQPEGETPREPAMLEFQEDGLAEIAEWRPHEPGGHVLEQTSAGELTIAVSDGEPCLASWRREVRLGRGKYRFEADMKASGVEANEDEKGRGGGLRISGSNRANSLSGDADFAALAFDFEVGDEAADVVLVAELRATKGTLWIRAPMRLRRLE